MTIRETSIKAYRQIVAEGLLSRERLRVYQYVFHHGPVTSGEAFARMVKDTRSPLSQSRARFTELRDMNVLREVGERKCKISGRMCIVWDVTKSLPGPLQEKECRLSKASLRVLRSIWKRSKNSTDRVAILRVLDLTKMEL